MLSSVYCFGLSSNHGMPSDNPFFYRENNQQFSTFVSENVDEIKVESISKVYQPEVTSFIVKITRVHDAGNNRLMTFAFFDDSGKEEFVKEVAFDKSKKPLKVAVNTELFRLIITIKSSFYTDSLPNVYGEPITVMTITTDSYTKEDVDYKEYYRPSILRNHYSENTSKSYLRRNLAPYLEVGKLIPNGGIFKNFPGHYYHDEISLYDVFEESPYRALEGRINRMPLYYYRYSWNQLEDNNGHYTFDIIEKHLQFCIQTKARLSIGLVCMERMSDNNYAGTAIDDNGIERKYSIPSYVFKRVQRSNYPMFAEYYGGAKWWSANLDSEIIFEKFSALLKALNSWLNGYVSGTNIKRRDVVFSVEERYVGDYGEGHLIQSQYPKTNLIEKYHNLIISLFNDKLIVVPGAFADQIPHMKESYNDSEKIRMHCYYNMLSKGSAKAATGVFRDAWGAYDSDFCITSDKVIMNDDGETISLARYLQEHTYPNGYNTGEFGDNLHSTTEYDISPYEVIFYEFNNMKQSGVALQNYKLYYPNHGIKISEGSSPLLGLYQYAREVLSATGYRIVLCRSAVSKTSDNKYKVDLAFANIGTSKVFADYYKIKIIASYNGKESIYISDFDIRKVVRYDKLSPMVYNPLKSVVCSVVIPDELNPGTVLRLRIDDEKGIEYPLTLSNYGRQMEDSSEGFKDGSYVLKVIE